jgi:hypothetical protein
MGPVGQELSQRVGKELGLHHVEQVARSAGSGVTPGSQESQGWSTARAREQQLTPAMGLERREAVSGTRLMKLFSGGRGREVRGFGFKEGMLPDSQMIS